MMRAGGGTTSKPAHASWADPALPDTRFLVGFSTGECALLQPLASDPAFEMLTLCNEGAVVCAGEVTQIRVVPRTLGRMFVAAFSTGEVR